MFKAFVINPPVFFGALLVIGVFLAVGVVFPRQADEIFVALQAGILTNFGWLYLLAVGVVLAAMLLLCLSRYGGLKLGPDDSTPDFSFPSWIAMLFAAGMGIGLMFYGVGEPMTHFAAPPEAAPLTIAAKREAMSVTFFHWGMHAWALYAVLGLSLAYFGGGSFVAILVFSLLLAVPWTPLPPLAEGMYQSDAVTFTWVR